MGEPQYHLEGIVRTKTETMEDFEGPLDVIFLLLSKNRIEIQDVSITAILEQYLAYLDEMKRLDMEIASEFITMASHLMLIKTKMLLSAAEQAEAENELDLLRQSLIERQRKEAMEGRNQAEALVMEVKEAFRVCGSSMNRQDRNQIKNDLSNLERLVHKHKPEKMSPEALPELRSAMDQLKSSSAALMQLYANHQQTQS